MWIFGYGSIIWKQEFEYVERRPGLIRGWTRRFYQGSRDHRGVPGAPGRVVTLLPEPEAHCWGVAFRIEGAEAERILARLDHREKGGYERHIEPVYKNLDEPEPPIARALVYLAAKGNPDYLGPAALDEIANQVITSQGPSGTNLDYVLELAESLRRLGVYDPHVHELERVLREMF